MHWRWDQGRLDYFQFDEIQHIARALAAYDGHALPRGDDPDLLRATLEKYSDRPFHPDHYKVWRNYKRVFGCLMLATELSGVMIATDLCKRVAAGDLSVDEYLFHIARRFSYPSPVFAGYHPSSSAQFPVCAIIKFLISEFIRNAKPLVSLDEIIDKVKGNNLTGAEPLSAYASLRSSGERIRPADDEYRQIRELLRFISQFSFLKWSNPNLLLDVSTPEEARSIAELSNPLVSVHKKDSAQELLVLGGSVETGFIPEIGETAGLNPFDQEFTEGSKLRVTHLKIERSKKLIELYFAHKTSPHECDMCSMNTRTHYPWASRLVELHHLLPLSSPVRVEEKSTSIKDIVGLCPSCHRATHRFYSGWLKDNNQKDFASKSQARSVYEMAAKNYVKSAH